MIGKSHSLSDGRTVSLREATAADAVVVLAYLDQVAGETDFISFGPGEFGKTEAEEAESLRKFREADDQLYLLAEVEGEIVSSLHFAVGARPRIRHRGEFGLTVRQPFWGLGLGTLMLDALIWWAREGDIVRKINLQVRTDNTRAIRLYERKGFILEGTIRKDICVDGIDYDHHCMGLEVRSNGVDQQTLPIAAAN